MVQHFDETFGSSAPENYERFFVPAIGEPLARDLLDRAALTPGERVLDVGCGTGIVARLAAREVGPEGRVAGLDVNAGMLAVARAASPDGPPPIEWHEASAEDMPLPEAGHDVVLCQMSLQFVPDRAAALGEMHRVLVPGGRVALGLPGPASPLFDVLADAAARRIAPEAAGFVRHVFSLHEPSEVRALLDGAGFEDARVERVERDLPLPAPEEFVWQYVGSTPLSALVGRADPDARDAFGREVIAGWEAFREGDGMALRQGMTLATARRPDGDGQ